MSKKDGGTKVIHTVGSVTIAQETADAMNANGNLTGNGTGFRFGVLPHSNGDASITATGPWHLPGNQRPAHGTMQTWAMGYAQCLADVANKGGMN